MKAENREINQNEKSRPPYSPVRNSMDNHCDLRNRIYYNVVFDMKVNLRKVKPLGFENSSHIAKVIDEGAGCLRYMEIIDKNGIGIGYIYHEDARALRDWLTKALGEKKDV